MAPEPLRGLRVVVTRERSQAAGMTRSLEDMGAEVISFPTIEIEPPESWEEVDSAVARLAAFEWVVFKSVNSARFFLDRMDALGVLAPGRAFPRTAAVGPATARVLAERGLPVDLVPEPHTAADLAAALGEGGGQVLVPRAEEVPASFEDTLRRGGWDVEPVVVYRTVTAAPAEEAVARLREGFDAVTFTSGSTVRGFVDLVGAEAVGPAVVACIGPQTAAVARGLTLRVDVVPSLHTTEGLATALAEHLSARPSAGTESGTMSP